MFYLIVYNGYHILIEPPVVATGRATTAVEVAAVLPQQYDAIKLVAGVPAVGPFSDADPKEYIEKVSVVAVPAVVPEINIPTNW
jgi:hypothetical protein